MTTENIHEYTGDLTETVMFDGSTELAALHDKLADALTPGFQAELDPEEAAHAGAFQETALSEEDATEGTDDLTAALEELEVSPR